MNFIEALRKTIGVFKPYNDNRYSNALKGKMGGTMVSMDDVAESGNVLVNLRSKNLIPYPYTFTDGEIHNGITFMRTNGGGIHISGTPTNRWFSFVFCRKPAAIITPEAGLYTASVGNVERIGLMVNAHETESDTSQIYFATQDGMPKTVKIDRNVNVFRLAVHSDTLAPIDVTVYPQLEYGTVATPYTPYVADDTAVTVKSCGKNLIPYPYRNSTMTVNGITFTDNGDGSITIDGTATNAALFTLSKGINFFSTNVYLGAETESKVSEGLCLSKRGNVKIHYEFWSGGAGTLFINCVSGETFDNVTVYPQIEVGTVATPYEPYIEGETIEVTMGSDNIDVLSPIAPNMTITTDNSGVILDVEYKRDSNIVIEKLTQAIISLGGNI